MMRVSVRSGDRRVTVQATGKASPATIRALEKSARRLFDALPETPASSPPEDESAAFGFSLSSDIERAPEPLPDYDEEDRTP